MSIENILRSLSTFAFPCDGDTVDNAHTAITPNFLIAAAGLTLYKQVIGQPLECMTPASFPDGWSAFAENYCWSQDSYFVRPDVHVELVKEADRYSESTRLSYYQWVPFLFLLQAACFRLPSILWQCANMNSGIRVREIVERACDSQNMETEIREKNLKILTLHITKALKFQRRINRRHILLHHAIKFFNLRYKACFISYMYLATKVLYLVNVVAQFYLINMFLRTDKYQWYGFDVVWDIIRGVQWESSGYFPRVSICDFTIRQVANIQKYSTQCVLVINIFNEKIFIFLWFWYVILAASTVISLVYWVVVTLCSTFGYWFISASLELSDLELDPKMSKKQIEQFVNDYLKQDGVFVLRMMSLHSGVIFSSELVASLFSVYHGLAGDLLPSPPPVPSYFECNQDEFLRRRKKGSLVAVDDDDDEGGGGGTTLIPSAPAGNQKSDSDNEDDNNKRHSHV